MGFGVPGEVGLVGLAVSLASFLAFEIDCLPLIVQEGLALMGIFGASVTVFCAFWILAR